MRKLPIPAAAALCAFLCAACSYRPGGAETTRTEWVLGTGCTIRVADGLRGDAAERAIDAAFARLREIEDRLSANKEGTDIDRVNRAAGGTPVAVSEDAVFVLGKALDYAALTDGAFDPSVGPLVKLWGIGTDAARVPAQSEIDAALRLVDWRAVELDRAAKTIRLAKIGMRLDLGAIAKGFAADEVRRVLLDAGVKAAIVDLGGNIYALGGKPGGSSWRIGIQVPRPESEVPRGVYLGVVEGRDLTLVTSGVYERFFERDGRSYHHILDPGTGWPVRNGLVSVTIAAGSSIDADALSTSLFVLGKERGMALAERLGGIAVVMVDEKDRISLSAAARGMFTLSSGDYALGD